MMIISLFSFEIEELFVPVMAPSQSSERQHDLEEFFKIVQQVSHVILVVIHAKVSRY